MSIKFSIFLRTSSYYPRDLSQHTIVVGIFLNVLNCYVNRKRDDRLHSTSEGCVIHSHSLPSILTFFWISWEIATSADRYSSRWMRESYESSWRNHRQSLKLIDIVSKTGRIGFTVPFIYRYRHTPRTNSAARACRLVDRDAINEINLPARWNDRLRPRGDSETRSKSRRLTFLGDSRRRIRRGRDNCERR